VKGSIRPRHQDDVMRKFNEWLKVATHDFGSTHANNLKQELAQMLQKEHIFNYPEEFLENVAKEVPKMVVEYGNLSFVDQQVMQMWQIAMVACLRASSRANVEFKLKENISKGKMPQIAKALRANDMISDPKTHKPEKLESKKGIEFLFQILADPANENHTMKYFIQQAGLTEAAVRYFTDGVSPDKHVQVISMGLDQLNKLNETQEVIQDTFEQFMEAIFEQLGDQKLNAEMLEKVVLPQYFNVLDIAFKDKDTKILDTYKQLMMQNVKAVQTANMPAPEGNAINFLLDWQQSVMDGQDKMTDNLIERTITYIKNLQDRSHGLNMLDDMVPDYSPLKVSINEFKSKADVAIKQIDKIRNDLQEPLLDKVQAAQQEQQAKMAEMQQQYQNMTQEQLQEVMVQQAKETMNHFAMIIQSGDEMQQKAMVNEILQAQNPILDNVMVETFETTDNAILKNYCAGIMIQKGYLEPLYDLVNKSIDENGNFDRSLDQVQNQAVAMAVEGLLKGIFAQDEQLAEKMSIMLVDVFHAVCDVDKPTPLMDQIFQTLINRMPNSTTEVEDLLIDSIIYNETANVGSKIAAIDILGRSHSMAFYPVFEEIAAHPEMIEELAEDQICLLDVALKSVCTYAKAYPELHDYSNVLNAVKTIDLNKLLAQAKEEGDETFNPEAVVTRIQDRIKTLEELINSNKANAA
ncbi:MAG: hypothetical protein AB7V50_08325, partial [Vampirovibrionia bacterium]